MANKTEKLPQIRVTKAQKEQIYRLVEQEDKKLSEFVLDKILNSASNAPSESFENKLLSLLFYYEKLRDDEKNVSLKYKYTNKINEIKDILIDFKRLDF